LKGGIAAQERAPVKIPTRRQSASWLVGSGWFRASVSGRKGRQPDPGFPEKVVSTSLCTMAPYLGSVEHAALPSKAKLCPFPPSHHRTFS
jgi:hypothetical protein